MARKLVASVVSGNTGTYASAGGLDTVKRSYVSRYKFADHPESERAEELGLKIWISGYLHGVIRVLIEPCNFVLVCHWCKYGVSIQCCK